jgi:putative transposase
MTAFDLSPKYKTMTKMRFPINYEEWRSTHEETIQRRTHHQSQRDELGIKVEDICREMGISNGTFYNWRSKYAGLEVNEAKRLKELESENTKLKKLLADKLLEVEAMKDVLSKKW